MREIVIFKGLRDQQAAEDLKMQSDVINHAYYEYQRYIVEKNWSIIRQSK